MDFAFTVTAQLMTISSTFPPRYWGGMTMENLQEPSAATPPCLSRFLFSLSPPTQLLRGSYAKADCYGSCHFSCPGPRHPREVLGETMTVVPSAHPSSAHLLLETQYHWVQRYTVSIHSPLSFDRCLESLAASLQVVLGL